MKKTSHTIDSEVKQMHVYQENDCYFRQVIKDCKRDITKTITKGSKEAPEGYLFSMEQVEELKKELLKDKSLNNSELLVVEQDGYFLVRLKKPIKRKKYTYKEMELV